MISPDLAATELHVIKTCWQLCSIAWCPSLALHASSKRRRRWRWRKSNPPWQPCCQIHGVISVPSCCPPPKKAKNMYVCCLFVFYLLPVSADKRVVFVCLWLCFQIVCMYIYLDFVSFGILNFPSKLYAPVSSSLLPSFWVLPLFWVCVWGSMCALPSRSLSHTRVTTHGR